MASGVAVLFGDKIRSQTKHFSYLFQLVAAKDPVYVCFIAFIQAEMEPPARPARLKTVKRVSNQLDVMRICPRDNQ
jgi:hypothetical protein